MVLLDFLWEDILVSNEEASKIFQLYVLSAVRAILSMKWEVRTSAEREKEKSWAKREGSMEKKSMVEWESKWIREM